MPSQVADVPEEWPVEGTEDLYRSRIPFALRADTVRRPGADDEDPFTRVVLEHPGAVVILAVDDEERVLCLRQYRHPVGRRMLELPAGLLDQEGEDPRAAAVRELREEAGLEATDWTPLTSVYSSPGISSELIHHFVARGLSDVGRGDFEPAHEEADMQTLWVPFADLEAACLDGSVQDAPVLIAVLTARRRGLVSAP
ncbi:NUDIX hydrolase [Nocardioides anomalus]|uniref:NUDIX hydrolase n=1 Tax=Nocardioides anomalus TaxID=2712223 RepID=A0A6G6WDK4_9ACTN|nr:NUDIX hydrolase [Nocardioides anomalus]QIG43408.1 NUDIX hydrolase [Nocardioides anomalus]